jgi:hypothetical protein
MCGEGLLDPIRLNNTRRDGVHGDSGWSQLMSELTGEAEQRRLGCGVSYTANDGPIRTSHRTEQHDPASLPFEVGYGSARAEEGAPDVEG